MRKFTKKHYDLIEVAFECDGFYSTSRNESDYDLVMDLTFLGLLEESGRQTVDPWLEWRLTLAGHELDALDFDGMFAFLLARDVIDVEGQILRRLMLLNVGEVIEQFAKQGSWAEMMTILMHNAPDDAEVMAKWSHDGKTGTFARFTRRGSFHLEGLLAFTGGEGEG
jgi:hypothetical protein